MLGITWTERYLGDGSAEADQSLDLPDLTPLDFFLWGYVKNIVYQVKINDLQHLKDRIRDAVAKVTPKDNWGDPFQRVNYSFVEAESNTSTVTLRVVGGDEKGRLESETVNYGHESHGTRTRKLLRWRGPGAIANDRPVLSSERESAPHQQTCNCLTVIKIWS
jgi:hypothetical protein